METTTARLSRFASFRSSDSSDAKTQSIVSPVSLDLLYRFCQAVSGIAMALAGVWLELATFYRAASEPRLRAIINDPVVGPLLSALAVLVLIAAALVFWSARRCRAGESDGRKILIGAIALAHGLLVVTVVVGYVRLPDLLRDLHLVRDTHLALRQQAFLQGAGIAWGLTLVFDIWFGWEMRSRGTCTAT